MKKFALIIEYGTGKAVMLVDTPDIQIALEKLTKERLKGLPDTKDIGLSPIKSAEILPVLYESIYENKEEAKNA